MEEAELLEKFSAFEEKFPQYSTEICEAMLDLERTAFDAETKAKEIVEKTQARIAEVDALIQACTTFSPMSESIQECFMQALVSFKPRLESSLEELNQLIENPPKESLYPQYENVDLSKAFAVSEAELKEAAENAKDDWQKAEKDWSKPFEMPAQEPKEPKDPADEKETTL